MSLVEVLSALRWPRYEAYAYSTLFHTGPMTAIEIAIAANIPRTRIYDVLSSLYKKGRVHKKGSRPTVYEALHPRYILEQELANIRTKIELELKDLEGGWDVKEERSFYNTEKVWTVEGTNGIAIELRELLRKAKRNIKIACRNFSWGTKKELDLMKELIVKEGVKINVLSTNLDTLKNIGGFGCDTKIVHELEQDWYIVDDKFALLVTGSNPATGIVVYDKPTVKLVVEKHDALLKKAKDIEVRKNEI